MSRTKSGEAAAGVRKYWREADARRALAALARSGLTLREFSQRSGISEKKLRRWRDRLEASPERAVAFQEVRVVSPPTLDAPREPDLAGEVVVGRYRVRAPLGFDESELRRLITTVASC